jgi:hypothetical protein
VEDPNEKGGPYDTVSIKLKASDGRTSNVKTYLMYDQESEIRKKLAKEMGEGFKHLDSVVTRLASINKAKAETKASKLRERLIRNGVASLDINDITAAVAAVLSTGKRRASAVSETVSTAEPSDTGVKDRGSDSD